jgi:hypothetical protein
VLKGQVAKGCTLSDPLGFHSRDLLENERNHQTMKINLQEGEARELFSIRADHIVLRRGKIRKG